MAITLNYMDLIAGYFPDTEAHTIGDPGIYTDIVFDTPAIQQADLDAFYLVEAKTQKILEFSEFAREDVVNGFDSSALGYPHRYDSDPEDQLNLIGAVASNSDMSFSCKASTPGKQEVDLGNTITVGTMATGFANTTTTYNAEVVIDGTSEYFSVAGQNAQTYDDLIAAMNTDFNTKATVSLNAGNLVITSNSYGVTSSINIVDANLFNQLSQYVGIGAADDGMDASSVALKEYKFHTQAQLLQVLSDGKTIKLDILQKFNVKKAQIMAAPDIAAIDAIVWE